METKLSPTDLANNLTDILERVSNRGERFVIERDGRKLATIAPPQRSPPGITVAELIARIGDLKTPGDGFADDVEEAIAAQGYATAPEWPDQSIPPSLSSWSDATSR